jgi:hypothetical protein
LSISRDGAIPDDVVAGATEVERCWLALAVDAIGDLAGALHTLARFSVHIVGDEHELFERARARLPSL